MMRDSLAAAGLSLLLSLAGPTAAQTPPEGIVWLALADINGARVHADDPTSHPPLAAAPPPGMITAIDLSPDGRPDWLVDYEAAGDARWCGTGGCRKRLYVSHGDGHVRAFDAQALALAVVGAGEGRRLEARVHHLYCVEDRGACLYTYAWDAEAGGLTLRPGPSTPRAASDRFTPLPSAQE